MEQEYKAFKFTGTPLLSKNIILMTNIRISYVVLLCI